MDTVKVASDFSHKRFTDSELSVKVSHVIEKMTNNPHFTSPEPSIETLSSANNSYISALGKQVNGSKMHTVIKRNCKEKLIELFKQLATYVQLTAQHDAGVILSSGFDLQERKARLGILDQPTGLTIKTGNNRGSLVASCDVVDKARFYEFQYTPAPVTAESIWKQKNSTSRKVLLDGLTSGCQYVIQVAGAASNPGRTWSVEITSYVL